MSKNYEHKPCLCEKKCSVNRYPSGEYLLSIPSYPVTLLLKESSALASAPSALKDGRSYLQTAIRAKVLDLCIASGIHHLASNVNKNQWGT